MRKELLKYSEERQAEAQSVWKNMKNGGNLDHQANSLNTYRNYNFLDKNSDAAAAMALIVEIEASQSNPRVLCFHCW